MIVTEEPGAETTTAEPILPTIVTDTDTGRGDSLGGYPSDYKSIVYVEDKSYHKVPAPYKSYEFVGTGKKMAYDMTDGNEVEKSLQVYKVQVSLSFLRMLDHQWSSNEIQFGIRLWYSVLLQATNTVKPSNNLENATFYLVLPYHYPRVLTHG